MNKKEISKADNQVNIFCLKTVKAVRSVCEFCKK